MPWSFKFCTGECDYKIQMVHHLDLNLVVHIAAVGVGTIGAPEFRIRWFIAIIK